MARFKIAMLIVFFVYPSIPWAQTLESGAAITDPYVVLHLQGTRFSAGAILFPKAPGAASFANDNLFKGALKTVGLRLMEDISTLPQQSPDSVSRDFFKASDSSGNRFSADLLNDPKSRFVLTGIINRMDRGYRIVDGISKYQTCGEIRFLYRFTYDVMVDEREVASRLPFTMAIVLNARSADTPLSCAEIAKRWQEAGIKTNTQELIQFLDSKNGPLDYLKPTQVDRVEMNLQLFRVPAGRKTDFGEMQSTCYEFSGAKCPAHHLSSRDWKTRLIERVCWLIQLNSPRSKNGSLRRVQ